MADEVASWLARFLAEHRARLIEEGTDWVDKSAVDLQGKRPRDEIRRLVERVVACNEALLLHGDTKPLDDFIDFVTTYRANSEFQISTLLTGFLSFRTAFLGLLEQPQLEARIAVELLRRIDDAFFMAALKVSDEYQQKVNRVVVARQSRLEREMAELATARLRETEEKLAIIEAQRQLLARLAFPVIRVRRGVIVMPVVGELTPERADEMTSRLLKAIPQHGAHAVLVDISGITSADAHTAGALLSTMRAVALLGARGLVVGVTPEFALAMVQCEAEVSRLETFATLEDGLAALHPSKPPRRRR